MFEQKSQLFENIFSKHQCGCRICFSTQQCLLAMSKNGKSLSIILKCLVLFSLVFECFDHKLFMAKLNTYGYSLTALKPVHNYL